VAQDGVRMAGRVFEKVKMENDKGKFKVDFKKRLYTSTINLIKFDFRYV